MRILSALKLLVFLPLILSIYPSSTQAVGDIDLNRLKRATVFIYQARDLGNELIITCVSSGTIVSYNGLIVTNANSIVQGTRCNGNTLIIALNVDLEEPPIPKYRAEILQVDTGLDIALLKINRELDGRIIADGTLPPLPFVEIADSSEVTIDQNITVIGYEGVNNQPVNITRGTITAFIAEPRGGNRSWFKTRATIPGAMSGGGAYNSRGQLIGIPITAPVTLSNSSISDASCKFIEDTNQDNTINNNDQCIPIGDFISTIRPSNFVQRLIRGASLGLNVNVLAVPEIRPNPIDPPKFSRLFFSPSVVDGLPSTIVGTLPANTNSLYLFFDYENMTSETVYEVRVTRDGIPETTFSLPPVRWSGGERGLWYVGSRDQPWANGVYEFTVLINGLSSGTQRITVGGGASITPSFSNIVFGLLDLQGNLLGNGYVLPSGSIASARFVYSNMRNDMNWTAIWYFNGGEVARSQDIWTFEENGSNVVNLRPQGGLFPGVYRLELYVNNALSATADFIVAGAQEGPLPTIFSDAHYTSANTPFEALNAPPISSFPNAPDVIYALFDWQQIAAGTLWTIRWLVDDQVFYEQTNPWVTSESGENFLLSVSQPPDGTYTLQLWINNLQIIETEAVVGIGQLPIDRFAEAEGVLFNGLIQDSSTKQGIPNVSIILISEDFSVSDFIWNQDQVFAIATTDRNGIFQFDRPLAIETPYSLVIEADGYLPVTADGFELDAEVGNTLTSTIEMISD